MGAANSCNNKLCMCLQKFRACFPRYAVLQCRQQEAALTGRVPILSRRLLIFGLSFIIIGDVSSASREPAATSI